MYILHRPAELLLTLQAVKHTVRNTAVPAQKSPELRCPQQDKHVRTAVVPVITESKSNILWNIYALGYIYPFFI